HTYPPPPPHHAYPPPPPVIHHVSHEPSHHHVPHVPPVIINHHHTDHYEKKYTDDKPTVRVYCKAKTDYALTIRDGQVVLAPSNPSDPHQHWVKDLKFSTRVKDEQGYPSFALVNKATGQAMKHSVGATYPVQLTEYNPDKLDESVLWTESKDLGDGYRAVRMVNNIKLNVDAFNGDKNHGGVRDGTKIVLWEWKKDSNQRWTMDIASCGISMSSSYILSWEPGRCYVPHHAVVMCICEM
ncbi:ricin B-like lectin R40G3, partial [Tanacetum coccineum]